MRITRDWRPLANRAFKVSARKAGTYQRDDQFGLEAVRPEHWLEHAFRPHSQHIEHAAGLGTKPTTELTAGLITQKKPFSSATGPR